MMLEQSLAELVGHYGFIALVASFGIGVLTSLAPCSIITLPLLIGSVLGLSAEMTPRQKQRFALYYSLLFVTGLVISFSLLMLTVAKAGALLSVAPFWAYALAAMATFLVTAYAMGWLGQIDKALIAGRLLKFKLAGALIIGMIFGLVSTPCASAPLAAIIAVAEQSGWVYSYALVLLFALGHGLLLLAAGISLGFAQRMASSPLLARIANGVNALFILLLAAIAVYLAYQAYLVY
ncbi:cytochrome c biogenesis protein CcdA [Sulfurimonas sp. HSL1-2]|uniref:cytochrome c biogenesis CcdA family protein n=1 Tax=Thiomicrolovo zhangzhouensis TaxID=3131933 RepID=UPI0031F99F7E